MVQEHTIKNFLHASRHGFGLGRYRPSTSIGNALEITSNGRARAFDKRANFNNSDVSKSSNLCLEKIILGGGIFSAVSAVTYLATGQSDWSTYIAPIVGGLVTAHIISEPTCKNEEQQNKSNYETQMQILDTTKPEEIKRTLERYKHYYY